MKTKITNNIGLKLLAIGLAFAVWLVVVNIDDPVTSYTYSGIPVEIINGQSLTQQGKTYNVLNNTDTINVTVTGKRTIVESIGKENIKAVADIESLTIMNTVEIQLSTNKNNDQLDGIRADRTFVELNVEELKESHLPITVEVKGEPQEGYVVGDIATNQNTIRVSGPESVVSKIDKAVAEANVSGRTSDITTTADIRFYDTDGNVIDMQNLSTNIKSVNLSIGILSTKAVEVVYQYTGEPVEGYLVASEVTADRMAVYIAGKQSVLDTIYSINVPDSEINIDGKKSEYSTTVDLSKYLPDGVRFADSNFSGVVTATVDIRKSIEKMINVPMNNITFGNIPIGYECEMLVNSKDIAESTSANSVNVLMKIDTYGIAEAYENVEGSDIYGLVDIASYMTQYDIDELKPGVYRMEIQFEFPDNIHAKDTYYADVKISAKEDKDNG